MPSYCCSSSDFLQSHYTVLLSTSFAFFMHLLKLLFISLSLSDPSGANLFFLSSLLLSHRSRISAVTQGFFLLTMFAKDLTGCFSHCCVEGVIIEPMSVSSPVMLSKSKTRSPGPSLLFSFCRYWRQPRNHSLWPGTRL